MAIVEWRDSDGTLRRRRLMGEIIIGRHDDAEVQLLLPGVSRRHARLFARDGQWWVEDLGSTNGTYVGGDRIQGATPLKLNDRFEVESTVIALRDDPPVAATGHVALHSLEIQSAVFERVRAVAEAFPPAASVSDPEQLREDYEKLRIANELSRSLAAEFDIPRLLDRVLEQAFRIFGADRGAILLTDEHGELVPTAFRVRTSEGEGEDGAAPFHLSSTILREVTQERTAVLSSDAMTDARFQQAQSIMMQGIRATMCVPLACGPTLHGVIALDSRLRGDVFTRKDLLLLTGFAQQAATMLEHVKLLEARERDLLAREQLGRLLAPEMVEAVMKGEVTLRPGGTEREATVLFADIRGFTTLSEHLPPGDVVDLLNAYFDRMVQVVFASGGTLDKFIGDELMAVWGAPIAREDHCLAAIEAAVGMQEAIARLNAERGLRGHPPIGIGIGINSGPLVAGFIGSHQAMNYTVIGDVVNVAARLCSAAPAGQVFVAGPAAASLPPFIHATRVEDRQLKGRSSTTSIYSLTRAPSPGGDAAV